MFEIFQRNLFFVVICVWLIKESPAPIRSYTDGARFTVRGKSNFAKSMSVLERATFFAWLTAGKFFVGVRGNFIEFSRLVMSSGGPADALISRHSVPAPKLPFLSFDSVSALENSEQFFELLWNCNFDARAYSRWNCVICGLIRKTDDFCSISSCFPY